MANYYIEENFPKEFVEIQVKQNISIDLRYASSNNFLKENVYQNFNQCFLHPAAAKAFLLASELLKEEAPHLRLLVYDCYRPPRIQKILWEKVQNTPLEKYVANPVKGSRHNSGLAIDVGLQNLKGVELDMGTPFDFFGELSEPRREKEYLQKGLLSLEALKNRETLRSVMEKAGFKQLSIEWWHFDFPLPKA